MPKQRMAYTRAASCVGVSAERGASGLVGMLSTGSGAGISPHRGPRTASHVPGGHSGVPMYRTPVRFLRSGSTTAPHRARHALTSAIAESRSIGHLQRCGFGLVVGSGHRGGAGGTDQVGPDAVPAGGPDVPAPDLARCFGFNLCPGVGRHWAFAVGHLRQPAWRYVQAGRQSSNAPALLRKPFTEFHAATVIAFAIVIKLHSQ